MAKIKDIATLAGVSITTVSRVLNQDKSFSVSDSTREKILQVAEELNYATPSQASKRRNNDDARLKIGLLYWYTTQDEFNDPYYFSLRLSIENECKNRNITLEKILITSDEFDKLKIDSLDGVIALGKYSKQTIEKMVALSPNLVLVDCFTPHYYVDVVISDLSSATCEIIEYYQKKKINDIALICGVEHTFDGNEIVDTRLSTYRNEMNRLGLLTEKRIYLGQFTADSGYAIMKEIINNNELVPGYIVASDSMAIGCLKALNEHHIKVPEKVSIISYDNTPLSQFTIPSLSTVSIETKVMGESAVTLITEKINGNREVAKKVIIPTKLIIRDSSK